jgi:acetyl-CoA carboxylase biotin carboxyl carrier protein
MGEARGTMSDKGTTDSDVSFIRALAELLRANDLTELEVKRDYGDNDRLNVRVSRGGVYVPPPAAPAPIRRLSRPPQPSASRPRRRPPPMPSAATQPAIRAP